MLTADDYRKFARECLAWSQQAATAEMQAAFLNLARDWTLAATASRDLAPSEPAQRSL